MTWCSLAGITNSLAGDAADVVDAAVASQDAITSAMGWVNAYSIIFVVAFVVTLLSTPLVRRVALAARIADFPDQTRKKHRQPVAYLGGVAVFLGIVAAIGVSYWPAGGAADAHPPVPFSVLLGVVVITFAGLADDVWGWDPRLKVAGQLVAAAALAIDDVGVRVAAGLLRPFGPYLEGLLGNPDLIVSLPGAEGIDLVYWAGTAIIAIFVLGGCNAANLIDGLDGLLSGTIAIVAVALLAISLLMAMHPWDVDGTEATLTGARIVLCFALLGAVLGFLPHNFNPATIFLGDCGSLLLGFLSVTIILMLGEQGQTHLVFAGLIVFSVPIMDTVLAIIRRKLSGQSLSAADNQHIHHQLLRSLGGVRKTVFVLYGISAAFAAVGVILAALVLTTELRVRAVYSIALVLFGFIGVMAFKAARRQELERQAALLERRRHPRDPAGRSNAPAKAPDSAPPPASDAPASPIPPAVASRSS